MRRTARTILFAILSPGSVGRCVGAGIAVLSLLCGCGKAAVRDLSPQEMILKQEERPCRVSFALGLLRPESKTLRDWEPSNRYNEIFPVGFGFRCDLEVSFCPVFASLYSARAVNFPGNSQTPIETTDPNWSPEWTYKYYYSDFTLLMPLVGGKIRLPIGVDVKKWFDTEKPHHLGAFTPYVKYMAGYSYLPKNLDFFYKDYTYNGTNYRGFKDTYWKKSQFLRTYVLGFGAEIQASPGLFLLIECEATFIDAPAVHRDDFRFSKSEDFLYYSFEVGLVMPPF